MKQIFTIVIMAVAIAITGCDSGDSQGPEAIATPSTINGTYVSGNSTYVFSSNGEVTKKGNITFPGDKMTTYKIDGGKVSLKFPEGYPMTLTINSDNSLSLEPLHDIVFKKVD